MNTLALVQRKEDLSYVDARYSHSPRATFIQDGSTPTPEFQSYNLYQANAKAILNRDWDHHRQTSRSTYLWKRGDGEKFEKSISHLTTSDYRGFIIDTLDADVYNPFSSPGLHMVPPEFANASHLIINDYPWSLTNNQEKTTLINGDIISKRQVIPIKKWSAKIVMRKEKTGHSFMGTYNSKKQWFHSRDFVTTMVEERANFDWKKEIIDECSRRLFEVSWANNTLEEIWLCQGDVIVGKEEKLDEKTTEFEIFFHYVEIEHPSKTDIIAWKKRNIARIIDREKEDRKRALRYNYQPRRITRHNPPVCKTPAELKAQKTLRDLISEKEWRRYLTNGFIMVRGKSGLHYQLFADQRNIQVWKNNNKTYSICIHTFKGCPPTDHVINCKLLIEFDEKEVWKGGNVGGEIRMSAIDMLVDQKWELITA